MMLENCDSAPAVVLRIASTIRSPPPTMSLMTKSSGYFPYSFAARTTLIAWSMASVSAPVANVNWSPVADPITLSSRSAGQGANSNCVPVQMFALKPLAAMLSVLCSIGMIAPQCGVEDLLALERVRVELLLYLLQLGELLVLETLEAIAAPPGPVRISAQAVRVELHDALARRAVPFRSLHRHLLFALCLPRPRGCMPTVRSRFVTLRKPRSSRAVMPRPRWCVLTPRIRPRARPAK